MFPSQSCQARYKDIALVKMSGYRRKNNRREGKNSCLSGAWLADSNSVEQMQMEMLWICGSVRKLTAQRSNGSVNGLDKDALMSNLERLAI
jgi:hypothetical protein